jgi:hypothetical protein
MTPDMITNLLEWLEGMWFPDRKAPETEEKIMHADDTISDAPGWDIPAPAPERPQLSLRTLIPDAPEEQWSDNAPPVRPTDDVGFSDNWSGHDAGSAPDDSDPPADDLNW